MYVPDGLPSYPALNQVYIGINEKEFGFMNNDLSYEINRDDIINRVEDYRPTKLTKIIGKNFLVMYAGNISSLEICVWK